MAPLARRGVLRATGCWRWGMGVMFLRDVDTGLAACVAALMANGAFMGSVVVWLGLWE